MDFTIRRLCAADFQEYVDFVDFVFSAAYKPSDLRKTLPKLYQPTNEHMGCNYAAIIGGKIRAAVGSYPITLHIADKPFKVAGIGAVTTHRDYAGMGLMSALMNEALLDMAKDGVALSVLGGERKRYGHFGYEQCGVQYSARLTVKNALQAADDTPVEFVEVKAEDNEYLHYIDRLYRLQPLYANRPLASLHQILTTWQSTPYIALINGKPAGYLIHRGERGLITELFAEADRPELYGKIAGAFIKSQDQSQRLVIPAWKPEYLRKVSGFAEEISIAHNYNWRVFDFAGVTQALFEVKCGWAGLAGRSAVIGIQGYGSLAIEVHGGNAICQKTSGKPDFIVDSLSAMRIIFGNLPPEAVYQGPKSDLFASWFPLPLCGLAADQV